MAFGILFFLLIISIIFYFLYFSYSFQIFLHKARVKNSLLDDFKNNVKGSFYKQGLFANSHKIISKREYETYSNRYKGNFSECYNIIKFKTNDAHWELFFHLVKEDYGFQEILNIRVFPNDIKIKSEGNVEKSYSRLNVFTNNSYLTHILETDGLDYLKWLIRYNGDIFLISPNNLHFKAFNVSKKVSVERIMDMIKSINAIKRSIYQKDIIEY
jgi:hypothetical protein